MNGWSRYVSTAIMPLPFAIRGIETKKSIVTRHHEEIISINRRFRRNRVSKRVSPKCFSGIKCERVNQTITTGEIGLVPLNCNRAHHSIRNRIFPFFTEDIRIEGNQSITIASKDQGIFIKHGTDVFHPAIAQSRRKWLDGVSPLTTKHLFGTPLRIFKMRPQISRSTGRNE